MKFIELTAASNGSEKIDVQADKIVRLKCQDWVHPTNGTIVFYEGGGSDLYRETKAEIKEKIAALEHVAQTPNNNMKGKR